MIFRARLRDRTLIVDGIKIKDKWVTLRGERLLSMCKTLADIEIELYKNDKFIKLEKITDKDSTFSEEELAKLTVADLKKLLVAKGIDNTQFKGKNKASLIELVKGE